MTDDNDFGQLRAAADSLDDARTDTEYGDIDMPSDELQGIVEEIDEQIGELESTLRKVALIAESKDEADDIELTVEDEDGEVTEAAITGAIHGLLLMEHAETDCDHQRILADVRRMVVGVFDREATLTEIRGDARIEAVRRVLEGIDPEDQHYTDPEEVERSIEQGLEFVDIYEDD